MSDQIQRAAEIEAAYAERKADYQADAWAAQSAHDVADQTWAGMPPLSDAEIARREAADGADFGPQQGDVAWTTAPAAEAGGGRAR
jgi:hypothetical protein